jgi:hypothetical protein
MVKILPSTGRCGPRERGNPFQKLISLLFKEPEECNTTSKQTFEIREALSYDNPADSALRVHSLVFTPRFPSGFIITVRKYVHSPVNA